MPDEEVVKRILPHSMEAERSVLGSMIMDADAVEAASEILSKDDFYLHQNGIIFEAILELYRSNTEIDTVTLQTKLEEKNLPPETCNARFIEQLVAEVPTSANVRSYANIVSEKAVLRRLIQSSEEIEKDCFAGTKSIDAIMDGAEKRIFDLTQRRGIRALTVLLLQADRGDAERQKVGKDVSRPDGQQLIRVAEQNNAAIPANTVEDAGEHLQGHHRRLVDDDQSDAVPRNGVQKVCIWALPKRAVDRACLDPGALGEVARSLAGRGGDHIRRKSVIALSEAMHDGFNERGLATARAAAVTS